MGDHLVRQLLRDACHRRCAKEVWRLMFAHTAVITEDGMPLHPRMQLKPRLDFVATNIIRLVEDRRSVKTRTYVAFNPPPSLRNLTPRRREHDFQVWHCLHDATH